MTLKHLITAISELAIREKLINFSAAGNSIYQLNGMNIDSYPVLFCSPTGRHLVREATTYYEITLFYIDRLTEDYSNELDVYSSSVEGLKNLILKINSLGGVLSVESNYNITNFQETERMNDRLGGAYATIRILTANDYCPE